MTHAIVVQLIPLKNIFKKLLVPVVIYINKRTDRLNIVTIQIFTEFLNKEIMYSYYLYYYLQVIVIQTLINRHLFKLFYPLYVFVECHRH